MALADAPALIGRTEAGCDCPECRSARGYSINEPIGLGAINKAEMLLRRFCTDKQIKQWQNDQRLTVVGSHGSRFLLTPRFSPDHRSVIRQDGLGISVWPERLRIAADWALGLKLYLEHNEVFVVASGCHNSGYKATFKRYAKKP